ncbi:MAG: hypothetical protein AAFO06_04420 [Cyanobacteria bacterium J06597_16]
MSGPENTSEPNKQSARRSVNVPFVFFGAFSASVTLMGASAISAETSLESAHPPIEGLSEKTPRLALNPDGSVEVESTKDSVKPTSQQIFQPLPKQENNDWRVILNEDGTLSVVPVDEVPEGATEVRCTEEGICTPVIETEEAVGSTQDASTEADSTQDASTEAEDCFHRVGRDLLCDSTQDASTEAEAASGTSTSEGSVSAQDASSSESEGTPSGYAS